MSLTAGAVIAMINRVRDHRVAVERTRGVNDPLSLQCDVACEALRGLATRMMREEVDREASVDVDAGDRAVEEWR